MFLKEALLLLVGLAAGSTVAAGVYAFLAVIGVYPRLMGKTATASKGKILLYETWIVLGGLFGNAADLFTEKIRRLGVRVFGAGWTWTDAGSDSAGRMTGIWGAEYRSSFVPFFGQTAGNLILMIAGLSCGIFVGCLVMSLAETLKALPVLSRRLRLAVGLQYLILALAAGKCAGSLYYFLYGIGRG